MSFRQRLQSWKPYWQRPMQKRSQIMRATKSFQKMLLMSMLGLASGVGSHAPYQTYQVQLSGFSVSKESSS